MSRKRGTRSQERYEPHRIIDTRRTWYVVSTVAALVLRDDEAIDRKADEALRKAGIDVWLPKYQTIEMRRGRKVETERLFFPGYLFAGTQTDDPAPLHRCRYVACILGQDKPLALKADLVQALADELTGDVKAERVAAAARLQVGEEYPVVAGPFATFLARVTALLANGRVKTDVAIFGRATPVEFDPGWLGAS